MTKENRTSRGLLLMLGAFAAGGAVGWMARSSTGSGTTGDWVDPPGGTDVPPVTDAEVHGAGSPARNLDDQLLPKTGFDPDFSGGHGTSVADQPWAGEDPIHRAF